MMTDNYTQNIKEAKKRRRQIKQRSRPNSKSEQNPFLIPFQSQNTSLDLPPVIYTKNKHLLKKQNYSEIQSPLPQQKPTSISFQPKIIPYNSCQKLQQFSNQEWYQFQKMQKKKSKKLSYSQTNFFKKSKFVNCKD